MLKNILRTISAAAQDPFLQGMVGLALLARSVSGITAHMAELHEQSEKIFSEAAERLAQAAAVNVQPPPADNRKPYQPPEEWKEEPARIRVPVDGSEGSGL